MRFDNRFVQIFDSPKSITQLEIKAVFHFVRSMFWHENIQEMEYLIERQILRKS